MLCKNELSKKYYFRYNLKDKENIMLRLRILEILEEQDHTKYWLYKQMDMSYQNFNKIVNNETSSIHFENLDKLSQILNVPVGDLFYQTKDED